MKEIVHRSKYRLGSLLSGLLLFVLTLAFLLVIIFNWNRCWYGHQAQIFKIIGCALMFVIAIPHIVFGCIPYTTKNMKAITIANSIIATFNLIWLGLGVWFFSRAPHYAITVVLIVVAFFSFINLFFLLEPKETQKIHTPVKTAPVTSQELLEKGILTNEEFQTLQTNIASKTTDLLKEKVQQLKEMEKQGMISKEELAILLQKLV